MEDKYYGLIIEYFEKTISDDGLTQLQEWIEQSNENLAQFSETIQILEASKAYFTPVHIDDSWKKVETHINQPAKDNVKPLNKGRWLAYAAACVIVFVCGWLSYTQVFKSVHDDFEVISNANGRQRKIQLPDGSVVYLGGGSTVKFAKNFSQKQREIFLDGEAFFDVVHQAKKPFIVKSGIVSTVVLGTSFDVHAYPASNKVIVTVESGKVGVMAGLNGKQHLVKYLVKNEQLQINTATGLYINSTVDEGSASNWTRNQLAFYNQSYREIATAIEHQYGVKIEFTDPELDNVKLTARFNNKTLNEVMNTLSALSGLAYTQKGRTSVYIKQQSKRRKAS
jgi:transmembrane sensor